jgi:hypothetical protein
MWMPRPRFRVLCQRGWGFDLTLERPRTFHSYLQPLVYDDGMSCHTEPSLTTDPALAGVLEELENREPIFHRPELGTTRADFENMMANDFWEIGASGHRYSKRYVLDELQKRYAGECLDNWQTQDFHCRKLADNVYLLTYTLLQGERTTCRSTIWQGTRSGWKIVFHQGTIVEKSCG